MVKTMGTFTSGSYRKMAILSAKKKREQKEAEEKRKGRAAKQTEVKKRKRATSKQKAQDDSSNLTVTTLGPPRMLKDRPSIKLTNVKPFMVEQGILANIKFNSTDEIHFEDGDIEGWNKVLVSLLSYLHSENSDSFMKVIGENKIVNDGVIIYRKQPAYSLEGKETSYNIPNTDYVLVVREDGKSKLYSLINLLIACNLPLQQVRLSILKGRQ